MRLLRTSFVLMASLVIVFALSAPASAADQHRATHPVTGDWAQWNSATNNLTVCDQSTGNGTAMAILEVIGGNVKTLFDNNGAQPGCGFDGNLNVDDTKSAYVWVCTDGSATNCWVRGPFGL